MSLKADNFVDRYAYAHPTQTEGTAAVPQRIGTWANVQLDETIELLQNPRGNESFETVDVGDLVSTQSADRTKFGRFEPTDNLARAVTSGTIAGPNGKIPAKIEHACATQIGYKKDFSGDGFTLDQALAATRDAINAHFAELNRRDGGEGAFELIALCTDQPDDADGGMVIAVFQHTGVTQRLRDAAS